MHNINLRRLQNNELLQIEITFSERETYASLAIPRLSKVCWNKIRLTNIALRVGEIVGTKNV